jgi:class 3 adenylate cyclase/tetratricopeptide (TPR) repeat protein
VTTCRSCGRENLGGGRYCAACGSELDLIAAAGEERKVVTVLFCDLVDFTARFDGADPEDVRETLAAYHDRVRREIERFGGTVEKFIGDAVMAVYGAPLAHEDDAQRAVLSALRIPVAVDELNRRLTEPLAVRIGVETGEAIVPVGQESSMQGLALGDVVNTTSRLQTIAPAGGVVVGERTFRLTGALFDFEPLDPVSVKGKAAPLRIWAVRGTRARFGDEAPRPPERPLVGRSRELQTLVGSFAAAVEGSSPHLVTIVGEPGIGKSRLLEELFSILDDRPDLVIWRQGRCLPYGEGVTFWALASIVKANAGIQEGDDADQARSKLSASVAAVIREPSEREWVSARLAPLIGLGEERDTSDRSESFSAWRRFLEAIAASYPLVIVIEDLHWADDALRAFVEHVVEWSMGVPLLILCTARFELFERDPRWGRTSRNSTVVSLSPLDELETARLLDDLLPPGAGPELRATLRDRAGGNPLFAQELARMIGERDPGAHGPDAGTMLFPETLQAVIAARLDTLPPDQKSLLQDASVVGRQFWPGALASVGERSPDTVMAILHELSRREIVRRSRDSSVEGQEEFLFAHALIRDVAYAQIPRRAKARKHVAAARWLERLAGERVSDHAEVLAHHLDSALDLSRAAGTVEGLEEIEATASAFWLMAGRRAMALDVTRAEACFDRALAPLPEGRPGRAPALLGKAESVLAAGRYGEAEAICAETIDAFRSLGDRIGEGAALDLMANVLWERGDVGACHQRLDRAVEILEAEPPGVELVEALTSMASVHLLSGRFRDAIAWCDRSQALASRLGADWLIPRALSFRGVARSLLGDPRGLEDLDEAQALAERSGMARANVLVFLVRAEIEWATDGPHRALEVVHRGEELAARRGLGDLLGGCRVLSLGPMFDLGLWDDVLAVGDGVSRRSEDLGGGYSATLVDPWIAQVHLWRGATRMASELAARGWERAQAMGEAQVFVPACVAAALIAVKTGRRDEALDIVGALERPSDFAFDWYQEQFVDEVVRVCVEAGDLELARRAIDRAKPTARRHHVSLVAAWASLDEAEGLAARALGRYLEAAIAWGSLGHTFAAARAWLGVGRVLAANDDPGAGAHLERARAGFEVLGASAAVEEVDLVATRR